MSNDSVIAIWEKFQKENPHAPKDYTVWRFGDSREMADVLANLVIDGKKTATSSNDILYGLENEPLPHIGLHNIILDGDGKAVAVLETISVEVVPFDEVTEEHAYLEGEGDRSLDYWREVHETFFKKEFKDIEQDFHYKMPVVCERFEIVYKK